MVTRSAVVRLQDVTFAYGTTPVLEEINLELLPGDMLGIVGPNGGGKTTLLQVLLGRLAPQRGQVELFGRRVANFRDWGRVGYVPQRAGLDPRFPATVGEVVATGRFGRAGLLKRLSRQDHEAVRRALEIVGMAAFIHQPIGWLSGGQQQRVFIARALAGEPSLLVLDEPLVGVDAEAQESFYRLLHHLNRHMGLTLLMVSHDIGVVAGELTALACINRRLVYHGPPADFPWEGLAGLYGRPVKAVVHAH